MMKKLFLLVAGLMAMMGLNVQAQTLVDWDENGQFFFYPEDLIPEGGISYDEDNACFVSDGTPGKLLINLNGATIDFSEVASIVVNGSEYANDVWSNDDPIGYLTITDAVNGKINQWYGSRYNVNFKDYAPKAAKVDSVYWETRHIDVEGEETTYVAGEFYIDEIVLTKSVEQDPLAITGEMWHEWDDCLVANANIVGDFKGDVLLNTVLGPGAVFAGQMAGTVLGSIYADLSQYTGIYLKGTPGMQWRGMFNRQEMGDAGAYLEVIVTLNEDGEASLIFAENELLKDAPFVHLNSCKIPWGGSEGKFSKFNYIDGAGVAGVIVDAEDADAPIYNILGQPVDASYKGLVIKNGKKYINK